MSDEEKTKTTPEAADTKHEETDPAPPSPKEEARPLQSTGKGGGGGDSLLRRGLVVYDKVREP